MARKTAENFMVDESGGQRRIVMRETSEWVKDLRGGKCRYVTRLASRSSNGYVGTSCGLNT